tara:strand:+ start:236 stop:472 length:237 start_codon:yes stop_codon:yes gene_type:complete
MAKKYKIKGGDLKGTGYNLDIHRAGLSDKLTLIKKWSKNGVEKCKVESVDGYEYIILAENLEEIKTKSNKKTKKENGN